MLTDLDEASARHGHECVYLCRIAVEVLYREGVDGDMRDVEFEEEREDPLERLEPFLVAYSDGEVARTRAAAVAVHDEGDVFWSRPEAEGAHEEGAEEGMEEPRDPREERREGEVDVRGGCIVSWRPDGRPPRQVGCQRGEHVGVSRTGGGGVDELRGRVTGAVLCVRLSSDLETFLKQV